MKTRSILLPSTVKLWEEGRRVPGYTFFDWLHGYVYGRWPYLYIGIATGEHPVGSISTRLWKVLETIVQFLQPKPEVGKAESANTNGGRNEFADGYHGKVVPLEAARKLVTVNEEVHLPDLEKVIPYPRARDIILKNPDHIVVMDCPCRASRPHPCLPLDVCLVVGEPFASFVEEHHPQRSRRITPMEAIRIMKAEDERGHVHHAFFKDAMLGRFYAICNCCSCCCGAMHAHQNGTPMLASSGYVCQVDVGACIACQACTDYCPFHALSLVDGSCCVDSDACMGCGICVSKCDQDALSLGRDPERGEPLEIDHLLGEKKFTVELSLERI